MSSVLSLFIDGYGQHLLHLTGLPTAPARRASIADIPTRSTRVSDTDWAAAVTRATTDGTTIADVLNTIIAAYGQRLLNLPRIEVIYDQPTSKETA